MKKMGEQMFLSVSQHTLKRRQVAHYLAVEKIEHPILASNLVIFPDELCYLELVDPVNTLIDMASEYEERFGLITICSSTCFFDPVDSVTINDNLGRILKLGGRLMFSSGKGCNTLTDAITASRQLLERSAYESALILYVEKTPKTFKRMQDYAFFSDVALAAKLSLVDGDYQLLKHHSRFSVQSEKEFTSECRLLPYSVVKEDMRTFTLNTFDFVQRFKYGKSELFLTIDRPSHDLHFYGADPYLQLALVDLGEVVTIHTESPPGFVDSIVLSRKM